MSKLTSALRAARQRLHVVRGKRLLGPRTRPIPTTWIGTSYGGWPLPEGILGPDSICYLAGLGEDASFDLELIAQFGCTVHAFDPVPEAVRYGTGIAESEPRFVFHPFGLWSEDTTLTFHEHSSEGYVSRSVTDMHGTGTGPALEVKDLARLPAELGHDHIDVLKLSVEGSEYELLDVIVDHRMDVETILVEFAQPAPLDRVAEHVDRMTANGWQLAAVSLKPFNWKVCLFKGR